MQLSVDEIMDLSFELDERFQCVRASGIDVPASATDDDKNAIKAIFGVSELLELELWLIQSKGPILLSTPVMGFGRPRRSVEHFHFEEIIDLYPEWVDRQWVPVASDGCGDYFVFALGSNVDDVRPVLRIDPTISTVNPVSIAASHLLLFMRRLIDAELNDEDEPFCAEVLAKEDPATLSIPLSDFTGAPVNLPSVN